MAPATTALPCSPVSGTRENNAGVSGPLRYKGMEEKSFQSPETVNLRDIYVLPENDLYVNSQASLKPLLESIRKDGIRVPVRLAKREEGGYYLVDGHRRCIAAAIAKIQNVPAIVQELSPRTLNVLRGSTNMRTHTDECPKSRGIISYAKAIVGKWLKRHPRRKPPKGKDR